MARVLITGASGLLGRAIYQEFVSSSSYDQVLGTAATRDHNGKFSKLDLRNETAIKDLVQSFKPHIIIHSAAERRPDIIERDEDSSRLLNVLSTRILCDEAKKVGAWVIYISSDYVFDGKEPPFKEDNQRTNPLNKYGQQKLDGELETLKADQNNAILRLPLLYGQVETLGESAVTVLFEKVKNAEERCVMSDYERRYPTLCDDVAVTLRQMTDRHIKEKDLSGYFHWSCDEEMTKYDICLTMADIFHLPSTHILASKEASAGAARPYNAHLGCDRLEGMAIGQRTSFRTGLRKCLQPWL